MPRVQIESAKNRSWLSSPAEGDIPKGCDLDPTRLQHIFRILIRNTSIAAREYQEMDYDLRNRQYKPSKAYGSPAPRHRNSYSSTTDAYHRGLPGQRNPKRNDYLESRLNGNFPPAPGYGVGSSGQQSLVHRPQSHQSRPLSAWEKSYHAGKTHDYDDRTDEARDGFEGVEQLAGQMMIVLKLKNAITHVADVVELYDGVDNSIGRGSSPKTYPKFPH